MKGRGVGKEERGARELPQRVPLTGDEDGAALSQRGRGRRTLIHSVESQMRPIYQPLFLRQLIAGLPRICDPGAYTMHLTKEVMTEFE